MATLRQTFKNIADAIRSKGISGTMTPLEMPTKIASIPSGGGDICLNKIVDWTTGKFDVEPDFADGNSFIINYGSKFSSTQQIACSFGVSGDDLSKWESEGTIGKVDAKVHIYQMSNSGSVLIQCSYSSVGQSQHWWASASNIFFMPADFFNNDQGEATIRIDNGRLFIHGVEITSSRFTDRSGINVFALVMANIILDWKETGKAHFANSETTGNPRTQILEVL